MSLLNNSGDPSSSLKQLQLLVNRVTQPDKSSHSQNKNTNNGTTGQTSQSQLSNCSSVDDEITVIWQTSPVTLPNTNSQNRQTSSTKTVNKTPIWQAVAHMENQLLESASKPSTNPIWPKCDSTGWEEKRKKRVICECPNCSVDGGNKTYSITGRLQHNCHIDGCGRTFDWPSLLQAHLKSHADNRPFPCTWYLCDKKFKRKEELVRHIKIHTGVRNYVCPRCNLGFARVDHLHRHTYKAHEKIKENRPPRKRKQK